MKTTQQTLWTALCATVLAAAVTAATAAEKDSGYEAFLPDGNVDKVGYDVQVFDALKDCRRSNQGGYHQRRCGYSIDRRSFKIEPREHSPYGNRRQYPRQSLQQSLIEQDVIPLGRTLHRYSMNNREHNEANNEVDPNSEKDECSNLGESRFLGGKPVHDRSLLRQLPTLADSPKSLRPNLLR